jgi:hypothetical protein
MKKTETIAEFLARGGSIQVIPAAQPKVKAETIKSTTGGGPVVMMSMGEADLYYGESKAKAKKPKKPIERLDLSALPEALRKKYVDEVLNAKNEEDDDAV